MTIELTRLGDVALIRLNRPEALNALSFAILREMRTMIAEATSSDARALLITGAGEKAFCAGADIKELRGRALMEQKRGAELGQAVFSELAEARQPSIAVINGYAFGGGLEMALACDFRLASPAAKLGLPEIELGLIPGYGGTQRLPRLIGEARATEMILTGRTVEAEEARRIGLVNQVVEGDSIDAGVAFARRFTQYASPALSFARAAVRRAGETPLAEGLRAEAELSTLAF